MLWLIETLVSVYFGYQLITLLTHREWSFQARFAAGIPIGVYTWTWSIFIWSYFWPMNTVQGSIVISVIGILGALLKFKNRNLKMNMVFSFNYYQQWTLIFCLFFYGLAMYASMLQGGKYTKGAAYSDLPFHLNIITSCAYGRNYIRKSFWDFDSTFYTGVKLSYPMMPDFFTATLVACGGASLHQALFIPSSLFMFSTIMSVYSITKHYCRSVFTSCLSILIFSCLGGLGFLVSIDPTVKSTDTLFYDVVHHWKGGREEYWFQTVMHILLPQRSALFGIPLCYWAILALIYAEKEENIKMTIVAALLVGFTPQVQAHAYMAMAQWSIAYCLVSFPWTDRSKWTSAFLRWLTFGVLANVMAFPQLPPFFNRLEANKVDFLKLKPIWSYRGRSIFTPIWMWWKALGVFGNVALFAGFTVASKEQIMIYIPSLVVFAIANIIRYQNWEYDNIKVFYDGWIPIAVPFVTQYLVFFFSNAKQRKRPTFNYFVFILLTGACVASGLLCIVMYLGSPTDIYRDDQLEYGNWAAENTLTNAAFIAESTTENPSASVAGRSVMMGYEGWIGSHGLDPWSRRSAISNLLSNPTKIENFEEYNVHYVLEYNNVSIFRVKEWMPWEIVFRNDNLTVYRRM